MEERIFLVPVGSVAEETLGLLAKKIAQRFECDVVLFPPVEVPEDAFVPERNQYNSSSILRDLRSSLDAKDQDKVLWITDVDLFVRDLNFIFGEAEIAGRCAIISLARLRPSYYGRQEDEQLLLGRIAKEAIHELGHIFSLGHCVDKKCVMYFSNSLWDTDQKSSDFCSRCKKAIENKKRCI
ncbi:MAG: archaemetzincin family Zn-dependent metalloprotease [Candidatus Aminicenantes bacterium]|jgi:archaemetzincin